MQEVRGSIPLSSTIYFSLAGVAELAFARVSKTRGGNLVWVRLPPPALLGCIFKMISATSMDVFGWTPELAYAIGLIATDGNFALPNKLLYISFNGSITMIRSHA